MTPRSIAIVGGGVLGLYLAHRLRAAGHAPVVFEAAGETGGLAAPADIGAFRWDRFYHVISLSDLRTRALIDELGLTDRLRFGTTRTGFYSGGRLYSLSSNLEFLRFPPLNLFDKARLALTILNAARIRDGRPLEYIPVEVWLRRWSGDRVTERIWLPLLRSKLGDNYRLASASFIWAIIARMYAARRSGQKREMFGYLDGGYELLLSRLRAALEASAIPVRTGVRIDAVRQEGARVAVTSGGAVQNFDHAVLTLPTFQVAKLVPQLAANEKARLESVVYQGIVCASLLLREPLGPYYVTNITDPGLPFTGVIEMTALVDRARFGGHALVYLPRYLAQDDAFWQADDGQVRAAFLAGLQSMYPTFNPTNIVAFHISRARHVLAVSSLRYSDEALPPVATSLAGISVVNSAQIANGTLNVNETIGVADAALPVLRDRLRVR